MGSVTYQTIRLSKGKHRSPTDGACVMELASMLAGEQFTDHPVSVCPVIAALLRSYNDWIDDRRRQDLYAYASRAVGSRANLAVERARTERLTAWTHERRPPERSWRGRLPALAPNPPIHVLAARAVEAIAAEDGRGHVRVLALVDELLELGRPGPHSPPSTASRPAAEWISSGAS
jgi:signal transduction histidine kinase